MDLSAPRHAALIAAVASPRIALHGAAPPALEAALAAAGLAPLRLDGAAPLAALLEGLEPPGLDLLWLEAPEALLGWGLGAPEVARIAWDEARPVASTVPEHLRRAGYALPAPGLAERRAGLPGAGDVTALRALAARLSPEEALPLLRLVAPFDGETRRALVEALTARGEWAEALHQAAGFCPAPAAAAGALEAFNRAVAAGDLAAAEPLAAALAAFRPDQVPVLEAAMATSHGAGRPLRAQRFARALLAVDPQHIGARIIRLEQALAEGDRAAELDCRSRLALSAPQAIHPLRRLHEAHRAISLHMLSPLDAARRAAVQALVGAARSVEPEALPAGEARHWARHYRHLAEAADAALLGHDAAPLPVERLWRAQGRPLGWAGLRREANEAKLAFVVAADAHYLRLYGRAYLASVLRHADVPAVILVHVIGGEGQLPALIRELGLRDPRIFFSADGFDAAAVTTQCHDSDGPRRLPVAHFQSTRFAIARRLLMELGCPVLVSDIDSVLQRGVAPLLARFNGCDVVLNRNEASEAFGSHLTANLLMAFPTQGGLGFLAALQGYLDTALAAPHVTRWIDQCGLQACWNASPARFGWFDTTADINNVMYPRWAPNPFLFLSLFHGFDMASLPAAA